MREVNSRPVPFELDFEWPQELWGAWCEDRQMWMRVCHETGPYAGQAFIGVCPGIYAALALTELPSSHSTPIEVTPKRLTLSEAVDFARCTPGEKFPVYGVGLYVLPIGDPVEVLYVR